MREGAVGYLDGEGLLEVLEEAVGLELVEVAALGALGLVELDGLVHERPHLLRLLLTKLLRTHTKADTHHKRERERGESDEELNFLQNRVAAEGGGETNLPEGVEEPDGLVLVRAGDEVIELLLVVRSSKYGRHLLQ
jgi:hypothetical protein